MSDSLPPVATNSSDPELRPSEGSEPGTVDRLNEPPPPVCCSKPMVFDGVFPSRHEPGMPAVWHCEECGNDMPWVSQLNAPVGSVEGTVDRLNERGTLAIKHNRPKLYVELECPHCGGLIHEGLHSRDGTLACIRFVHRQS